MFKKIKKIKFSSILINTILLIWSIGTIYPFIWVTLNSFKPSNDVITDSFSLPFKNFTLENYKNIINGTYSIFRSFFNSIIISVTVVIVVLIIAGLAAFALARYNFKGKKIVFGFVVACMMFPIFSIIYPLYTLLVKTGLTGSYLGVILPQIAGNIGFAIIVLTGFIRQLPIEVEESAYIDGANLFQTLVHIVLPMSKSAFATTSVFVFLWSYNDLFLQMLVLKEKEMMPISALLREISSKYGTDFGLMAASVAIIAIPIIIVYIILQKHIIKGLTAGAIKG
jgi:raffinose/stachyose/melibiose transport system permease protein